VQRVVRGDEIGRRVLLEMYARSYLEGSFRPTRRARSDCHTAGMPTAQIVARWRADLVALRHLASPPPRLSGWSWLADVALALVLTAGTVSGALNRAAGGSALPQSAPSVPAGVPGAPNVLPHYEAAQWWQLMLAVLAALPLLARRRFPIAVFWTVTVAGLLYHLSPGFDATFTFAACLVGAASALAYSRHPLVALASALVGTGLLVGWHQADVPAIRPGLVTILLLIPVALTVNAVHQWSQRVQAAQAEQEAAARAAVDRERARIARELHDVVTHNVSMMVIQAGAARTVLTKAPDQAREALLAVEAGGRTAMNELRHVIDLLDLRQESGEPDDADLLPAPGLDQLPALVARVNAAGVPVRLTVTGEATPLSSGAELAAYRVIQEALTNVMKHAVGARADVTVEFCPQALHVQVRDTGGTAHQTASTGGGRGLIGLRERLAVYGGALTAEPLPDGGYQVRAEIPLEQP
jgi:signal transduction histidine kinase